MTFILVFMIFVHLTSKEGFHPGAIRYQSMFDGSNQGAGTNYYNTWEAES
jgi:hypothetical protein